MIQWNVAAVAAYQKTCSISRTFLHPLRSRPQARHYPTAGQSAVKGPIYNRTQKSLQVHVKEQMSKEMPKDLGILPGTLIMPTGAKKPSFLLETRLRWNLEMRRLRTRFEDFRGILTYKFGIKGKPYPKFARRRIAPTATALHRQMCTAFVENDIATLSSICTEGLLASFKARIALRPRSEIHRWTLHKYTHSPRIVSNRAGLLTKGAAIRQAIVRIRSIQSLTKFVRGRPGEKDIVINGTGEKKEMDEYFVLQRRIWKEKEEPWMVWGTTQESSIDNVSR